KVYLRISYFHLFIQHCKILSSDTDRLNITFISLGAYQSFIPLLEKIAKVYSFAPAETLIQEISKNLDDDKIIFFDKKSENKRKLFLRNEFVENFRYIQRTIVSIDKKLVSFLDEDNKHKREISKHAIQNYRNREKYEKLLVDSASELN